MKVGECCRKRRWTPLTRKANAEPLAQSSCMKRTTTSRDPNRPETRLFRDLSGIEAVRKTITELKVGDFTVSRAEGSS